MLVLPEKVDELLVRAVADGADGTGGHMQKKDLVSALVMLSSPEDPLKLASLFLSYLADVSLGASPLSLATKAVTVVLPARVTQRLDLLVAAARDGGAGKVLRRDIVAALALLEMPREASDVAGLHQAYLGCLAQEAAVEGAPLKRVLSLETPKPGRRAYAGDVSPAG